MTVASRISDDIHAAARALAANATWRAFLAENLYWASCEAFLQSSLLGQFNLGSESYVAAREREIERGLKPDIVIIERAHHDAWWAHTQGDAARETRSRLCRAAVEMKLVWTSGNAYGSAVATAKATSIAADLARLRDADGDFERYLAVTVAGFHEAADGEKEISAAREIVRKPLGNHVDEYSDIVLLDAYCSERWKVMAKQAWCAFATFILFHVR